MEPSVSTELSEISDQTTVRSLDQQEIELPLEDPGVPRTLDAREDFLFVKAVEGGTAEYQGYKRDFLAQTITSDQEILLKCAVCQGIPREAIECEDGTKCLVCSTQEEPPHEGVRELVNQLEVMCPLLRACEWSGKMCDIISHLDECLFLHLECPMRCEVVIPRGALESHTYNECMQRKINCDYCKQFGLAKGLEKHYKVCKEFPVMCPHGCGDSVPRRQSELHRNTNCPLTEVTCPYSKYGCCALRMTRKELIVHKQENVSEHLDMSSEFHARRLGQAEEEIRRLRDELSHSKMQMKYKKDLDGVEWKIEGISGKMDKKGMLEGPIFFVGPLKLQGLVRFERRIKSNAVSFHIKRLSKGKEPLQNEARFTYCCVTLVNLKNEGKSKLLERHVSYKIEVDQTSDCIAQFTYDDIKNPDYQRENSIFVWLHFDLDAEIKQETPQSVPVWESSRRSFYRTVLLPRGGGQSHPSRRDSKHLAF